MIEKDGLMIFTLKEVEYLKEYYSKLTIGRIVMGSYEIKLFEINIVDSNKKGMYVLQMKGFKLNQPNAHIKTRIENLIEELNLKHPKIVLQKMDA